MSGKPKYETCLKCGKPKDGSHVCWCKSCYNEYKREHYSKHREKEIARAMEYNKKNYDRFLQGLKRYRSGDKYRATRKAWEEANHEKVALWNAQKRAKRRAAVDASVQKITAEEWREIKARYQNCCAYCGKKQQRLTMDHVVPLSSGGSHSADNIVPACSSCNNKKNAKEQIVFYQSLGFLL